MSFKGLSISNIAWANEFNDEIREMLLSSGFNGIEVAPAKVVDNFDDICWQDVQNYKKYWLESEIQISSMQALMYGGPAVNMFANGTERTIFIEHLKKVISMANVFEASQLVLGSPKNRLRDGLTIEEANNIAIEVFYELGQFAYESGCKLCLEPNPEYYGCDYIVNSNEAFSLAESVGSPGFGVHLDTAGMILSNEDPLQIINNYRGRFSHFHISEKDLKPIDLNSTIHERVAHSLKSLNYSGWAVVEMRDAGLTSKEIRLICLHLANLYR